jgi:general secretion pathway protein D
MSELLHKNIIIDHKVPGTVTIVSPKPIPISQAYMVLKTVLAQYGFLPVEEGEVIRIIQLLDALKMDTELRLTTDLKSYQITDFDDKRKNVTHVVILGYAKSTEILATLRMIAPKEINLVAYDKANALILVGNSVDILHLISVARELDNRSQLSELSTLRRIHIYHLENADAEKLASVLAKLRFEMPEEGANKKGPAQPAVKKGGAGRQVRKPLDPKEKENAIKVDVIANKETNSLIITAAADVYKEVKRVIAELDTVRRQVLVEALIVEISGDGSWGAGIEWRHGSALNYGKTLAPIPKGMDGAGLITGSSTDLAKDWASSAGTLPGLSMGLLRGLPVPGADGKMTTIPDIYAFLNLYSRDQEVNILSTPQIVVTDNNEAELNVGAQIPVLSNMRVDVGSNVLRSYDLKPVGIKLKITPHINKNQFVSLDIYQEVKSVVGDTTQLVDIPPIISNRDIKTKITIKDQHTIVIGGLIQSEKTETERKTPIIGDIPILGWLFKRKSRSTRKTNLLVFITPHLITNTKEIDAVTKKKRIELEKIRKLYDWNIDQR